MNGNFNNQENYSNIRILGIFVTLSFLGTLFFANTDISIIKYGGVYEKLYNNQKFISIILSFLYASVSIYDRKKDISKKLYMEFSFIIFFITGIILIPIYISVVGDFLLTQMILNNKRKLIIEKAIVVEKHKHTARAHTNYYISLNIKKNNLNFHHFVNKDFYEKIEKRDTLNMKCYFIENGTIYINKKDALIK